MKRIITALMIVMCVVGFANSRKIVEYVPLPDTLIGKHDTTIRVHTMRITRHMKDTAIEVSRDTVILKESHVKKEESKKAVSVQPAVPVKK